MRNTDQAIQARRNEIMLECQRKGKVSVNELSERFNVSPLTIRRDLQFWEDSNAMIRNYGGAKLVQSFIPETNLNQDNEYAKHAIAKFAAGLVEDNDTIFINTSSTALLILKYIKNKHVNVDANNLCLIIFFVLFISISQSACFYKSYIFIKSFLRRGLTFSRKILLQKLTNLQNI